MNLKFIIFLQIILFSVVGLGKELAEKGVENYNNKNIAVILGTNIPEMRSSDDGGLSRNAIIIISTVIPAGVALLALLVACCSE